VLEVVAGLMPAFAMLGVALVPVGLANITFSTAANSSVQLASAPEMRGRVMGLYMLVLREARQSGRRCGLDLPGIRRQVGPHRRRGRQCRRRSLVLALSLRHAAARRYALQASGQPGGPGGPNGPDGPRLRLAGPVPASAQ